MSGGKDESVVTADVHADRLLANAARASDTARARVSGAMNDLFRSPESRLTDREHATMHRMLTTLMVTLEQQLRGHMVEGGLLDGKGQIMDELADPDRMLAWPRLARSRVMRDPDLIRLLLRRVHEHHLSLALRAAYPVRSPSDRRRMDELSRHPDPAVRVEAMAFLQIESRRWDEFGEPLLDPAELPVALQHRVFWWVAAALRDHMCSLASEERATADRALVLAASALLEVADDSARSDSIALRLARELMAIEELDDATIVGLFREGQIALVTASLASRARMEMETVWEMLADRDASRLTLLLRAIGMERRAGVGLLVDLFTARAGSSTAQDGRIEQTAAAFDALTIEEALAAIKPWRPAHHFRGAIARLSLDELLS